MAMDRLNGDFGVVDALLDKSSVSVMTTGPPRPSSAHTCRGFFDRQQTPRLYQEHQTSGEFHSTI
jgi:hypothetical protein